MYFIQIPNYNFIWLYYIIAKELLRFKKYYLQTTRGIFFRKLDKQIR